MDEYEGDTLSGRAQRTSVQPLSLGALAEFFLAASDAEAVVAYNFSRADASLDEALDFISGESAFYPQFDALLRQRIAIEWAQTHDVGASHV